MVKSLQKLADREDRGEWSVPCPWRDNDVRPLDKHVANVCATCFYWFRKLRRVRRLLDAESAAMLFHAFVTLRMDYRNAILAGAGYPSLRQTSSRELWMLLLASSATFGSTIADSPVYCMTNWVGAVQAVCNSSPMSAAQGTTVQYIKDCCIRTSDIIRWQHLRSFTQLLVPQYRSSMFGRRAFSVASPATWNSFPDSLRDPTHSVDSFRRDLKTFHYTNIHNALGALRFCVIYKSTVDIWHLI